MIDSGTQLDLRLVSRRESCEAARYALLDFIRPHGIAPRTLFSLELVLEETLMNAIWHAFDDSEEHFIEFSARIDPHSIVLKFEDDGVAFDPVQAPIPAIPGSIDEAVPGGLGLLLVRKIAESITYTRLGDRNRLTISVARD